MTFIDYYISKVGSNGELFLPAKLRKKLGLEPGMRIIFLIVKERLIVEIVPEVDELLKSKEVLNEISIEELKDERRDLEHSYQ